MAGAADSKSKGLSPVAKPDACRESQSIPRDRHCGQRGQVSPVLAILGTFLGE